MNYNILWSGALATALVLIVTFWKSHLEKRKRIRGHREALRTEILMCGGYARVFRQDGVASPLYRLPTSCFAVSFAALLADGALMDSDAGLLAGEAAHKSFAAIPPPGRPRTPARRIKNYRKKGWRTIGDENEYWVLAVPSRPVASRSDTSLWSGSRIGRLAC